MRQLGKLVEGVALIRGQVPTIPQLVIQSIHQAELLRCDVREAVELALEGKEHRLLPRVVLQGGLEIFHSVEEGSILLVHQLGMVLHSLECS